MGKISSRSVDSWVLVAFDNIECARFTPAIKSLIFGYLKKPMSIDHVSILSSRYRYLRKRNVTSVGCEFRLVSLDPPSRSQCIRIDTPYYLQGTHLNI